MLPNDFFSPENQPKLIIASALLALAIGMIIYQVTENMVLSVATGVFLVVADVIALKMLCNHKDK